MPSNLIHKAQLKIAVIQGRKLQSEKGESVFDQIDNWDIAILLDGCRFDTFKQTNKIKGKLKKIISMGSCTPEWAQSSLNSKYPELVYVSANPFISDYYLEKWNKEGIFAYLEPLWDIGWDQDLKTVTPMTVINATKKLLKKFPNKKFFIHFMQPHHPYIGKKNIDGGGWKISRDIIKGVKDKDGYKDNVYTLLEKGRIPLEEVLKAYQDNLQLVLKSIDQELLPLLKNKKVVITADHGNCFGEYGIYSHPQDTPVKELIEVPWLEVA